MSNSDLAAEEFESQVSLIVLLRLNYSQILNSACFHRHFKTALICSFSWVPYVYSEEIAR